MRFELNELVKITVTLKLMASGWSWTGAAFRETIERVNLCRNTLDSELLTGSLSICIDFIILPSFPSTFYE